jgi:hypothetical protein
LKLTERLPLATDQAAGIIRLDVEEDLAFQVVLIDSRFEAKSGQKLFKDCFWVCCHK